MRRVSGKTRKLGQPPCPLLRAGLRVLAALTIAVTCLDGRHTTCRVSSASPGTRSEQRRGARRRKRSRVRMRSACVDATRAMDLMVQNLRCLRCIASHRGTSVGIFGCAVPGPFYRESGDLQRGVAWHGMLGSEVACPAHTHGAANRAVQPRGLGSAAHAPPGRGRRCPRCSGSPRS